MGTRVDLELKVFNRPNFVLVVEPPRPRGLGFQEGRKFHLREIGAEELATLCDRFRAGIFEAVGKSDPLQEVP